MKFFGTHVPKYFLSGYGVDPIQQENMSSIRALSSLENAGLCNIEALAEASLRRHDLALAKVRGCHGVGIELEDIYLNCLVPAAHLLGKWWLSDRVDFAEVTIGIQSLQSILYEFSPQFLRGADQKLNGYSAIFFSSPRSQHSFGSVMLAEFFRHEGWKASNLAPQSEAEVLQELSREWFEVVGFSVSSDREVDALRSMIHKARQASMNPKILLMVGGPMADLDPGLLLGLGADLIGGDARDSQRLAYQHVKKSKHVA